MPDQGEITVVTVAPASERRDRGDALRRVVEAGVPLEVLGQSLSRFLDSLAALLDSHDTPAGPFELSEVGFSAEIGADGQFKLLGAGAGVSATSGVVLTWRRREPPASGGGAQRDTAS